MKNTLLALLIVSVGLSACSKQQPKPRTKEQINQQIDSITRYRNAEIDDRAKVELEHRIKIEVKIKVDSMLKAAQLPKDTINLRRHHRLPHLYPRSPNNIQL